MLKLHLSASLNSGAVLNAEADNLIELDQALKYFHSIGQLGGPVAVVDAPNVEPPPGRAITEEESAETLAADIAAEQAAAAAATAQKTRKPRAKKEPEKSANEDTGEKSANEDTGEQPALVKVTAEDAAAAITSVANTMGLPRAKLMLDVFKVKRASELQPEQYASFVKECNALMKDFLEAKDAEDPEDEADIL